MKEFKYTVLYCVCENFCDFILQRFRIRFRNRNSLRFLFRPFSTLRFRFRLSKSYGSYGSGSTTLLSKSDNMDQITIKTPNPKGCLFLKNWPVKGFGGRCLSVLGPRSPVTHCINTVYIPVLAHTGKEGGSTSEKVKRPLVHKKSRKYQHDWLYLQSINSIKHQ
jgi:hypothetical protein